MHFSMVSSCSNSPLDFLLFISGLSKLRREINKIDYLLDIRVDHCNILLAWGISFCLHHELRFVFVDLSPLVDIWMWSNQRNSGVDNYLTQLISGDGYF